MNYGGGLVVAEGRFNDGRSFKVTAYTWRDRPWRGLRYDGYLDGCKVFQSMNIGQLLTWLPHDAVITPHEDALNAV